MIVKIEFDDLIVNNYCTRFGFDQIDQVKHPITKEDFFINKIGQYVKGEAAEHAGAQAGAVASKTAKDAIEALEIKKGK